MLFGFLNFLMVRYRFVFISTRLRHMTEETRIEFNEIGDECPLSKYEFSAIAKDVLKFRGQTCFFEFDSSSRQVVGWRLFHSYQFICAFGFDFYYSRVQ